MTVFGVRTDQAFSQAQLDRFAVKVQDFYEGLDDDERQLLMAVLLQGTEQQDVQAYTTGFKFEPLPPMPAPPMPQLPLNDPPLAPWRP